MKLKYKKIILLTSLSTMGIGLLTLSISQGPRAEGQINEATQLESGNLDSVDTADYDSGSDDSNEIKDTEMKAMAAIESISEDTVSSIQASTPAPSPTPTPLPVYPLEEV